MVKHGRLNSGHEQLMACPALPSQIISMKPGGLAHEQGLALNHHILSVNGRRVVGLSDQELIQALRAAGTEVRLCTVPAHLYQCVLLDHGIP